MYQQTRAQIKIEVVREATLKLETVETDGTDDDNEII